MHRLAHGADIPSEYQHDFAAEYLWRCLCAASTAVAHGGDHALLLPDASKRGPGTTRPF